MNNTCNNKLKQAFTRIYTEKSWGEVNLSGAGSSLDATKVVREIMLTVIRDYKINSVVDVACGDFVWMPLVLEQIAENIKYKGCDIVDSLVEQHKIKYPEYDFQSIDFVNEKIPEAELIFCRDALQHLPVKEIKKALANFSNSGARYLLASTHPRYFGFRNSRNIRPGRCRDRNLMIAPFNLANPLVIYSEESMRSDKFLGLWRLPFKV